MAVSTKEHSSAISPLRRVIADLNRIPKAALLMIVLPSYTAGILTIGLRDYSPSVFWKLIVGTMPGFLVIYLLSKDSRLHIEGSAKASFLELDKPARRTTIDDGLLKEAAAEIKALKKMAGGGRPDTDGILLRLRMAEIEATTRGIEENIRRPTVPETFVHQMSTIAQLLEDKASVCDMKASRLLDRGVTYSIFGIFVFIVSIIAWQVLSWSKGFQTQFAFGIGSCALLFVFLQYLSSWFLKQYRHFVEVSTYLIEIKSVFDRYLLLFHMLNKSVEVDQLRLGIVDALVKSLSEEMKWPRARPAFTEDPYYAKDAMSATEQAAKIFRESRQPPAG